MVVGVVGGYLLKLCHNLVGERKIKMVKQGQEIVTLSVK